MSHSTHEHPITMNPWPRLGVAIAAILFTAASAGAQGGVSSGGAATSASQALFDGKSLNGWKQVGQGRFVVQSDGSVVGEGGMGLLYYAARPFRDFVLDLDYKAESAGAKSGIFVRFPEQPKLPADAIKGGYEIQIDNLADAIHTTGSIYNVSAPTRMAARPAGQWNHYRIEVSGQRYQIYLNGEKVNDFFGDRGRQGYIALENHDVDSRVHFRNVQVTPLRVANAPESLGELFAVRGKGAPIKVLLVTATTGFRHFEAIDAAKKVMADIDKSTEFDVTMSEDVNAIFTPENLAKYDLLFLSNSTLRVAQPEDAVRPEGIPNHPNPAARLTKAQEQAMLDFVRGGKGLVVTHSGVDAFYGSRGYREMIGGGLFQAHPWTQHVGVKVEDRTNAAVSHLGDGFGLRDKIYVTDTNPRWNSHVLLSLDMPSVGVDGHPDATRDDYPLSWIRHYGRGRVFVTVLGHFGDVWRSPAYLQHVLQGMRIAAGRVPADFSGHRVKETISANVWPDDLAIDDAGNVWIAELTGKIHRYDATTKQTALVGQLDTTDPTNIEHGLLGIEVDPNFARGEPYLYVFYTKPEAYVNTLSRFTFTDGKIDMATEKVLLRVPTEPHCCHQAGDLEWGPNGTIFVSTGDTGESGTKPEDEISDVRIKAFEERNKLSGHHWSRLVDSERTGQSLQELRGKVLRVNKDGSIPKDNPFYGKPGVRWEIFAYGLRNPYRIKWDDQAKRLFIGIVGPDENVTYDWYDIATGGENFGWPRANGKLFYNEWTPAMIPGYVPPAWEYTYAGGSRSAGGGPTYHSTGKNAFPQLQGKVLMFDWSRKWIKYGDIVNGTFESDTAADMRATKRQFRIPAKRLANIKTFDMLTTTSPISMDVGPDGCVYVAEFAGFWKAAAGANVSRYCWVPGDAAPPRAAAEGAGIKAAGSR
ncbi:MAG: ThuA domain-containing protein [Gemmatimonadaceae bacterium]